MFETMVGYNPDSPIKGLPEFISKEKQAAMALEQEKYKLEIHKAELENKKNELAQKHSDYFWKALDTASKYKGQTRKNILKAIPSIIKQQTGKDVSPDVANAFMSMAGEGEPGNLGALDMNRATTDIDYRNGVVIPAIQGMLGSDNPIDALDYYNKFTQTEQKQMQIDANASNQLSLEKAKQSSAKENLDIKEQQTFREKKRESFDKLMAEARKTGSLKDRPEWYQQYVEANPDEQLKMESELQAEVSKNSLAADKAARASLEKQIGMALKYSSPAEASIIRKLTDPNSSEEVKALANDTLNSVLGRSGNAESAKQSNEVSRGALGNAKAAIDLGGGEGLSTQETKGLIGGKVTPVEQAAIETAQQRKMLNASKKANKSSGGMTPNQQQSLITTLSKQADDVDKKAEQLYASDRIIQILKNAKGPILDQSVIPQYMNMVAGAPSILRPEELKTFYSNQGIAGTIDSFAKRMAGEGGLSQPTVTELKKIAILFNSLALKSYKARLSGVQERARVNGIPTNQVLSDQILNNINRATKVEHVEDFYSNKKVASKEKLIQEFRKRRPNITEAEIERSLKMLTDKGVKIQ